MLVVINVGQSLSHISVGRYQCWSIIILYLLISMLVVINVDQSLSHQCWSLSMLVSRYLISMLVVINVDGILNYLMNDIDVMDWFMVGSVA